MDRRESFHKAKTKLRSRIFRRLHFITWIKTYKVTYIIWDLLMGIVMGLVLIPQSLCCSLLADINPIYGFYGIIVGHIVYFFLGTVKELNMGPTSVTTLLTIAYTLHKPLKFTVMFTFLSGCIQIIWAFFHLDFLVNFISIPIIRAFVLAHSLIIVFSQLHHLIGFKYSSIDIVDSMRQIISNATFDHLSDGILGTCTCLFLIVIKILLNLKSHNVFRQINNLLDLIILIIATGSIQLHTFLTGQQLFQTYKENSTELEIVCNISLPFYQIEYDDEVYSYRELIGEFGVGIIAVSLISASINAQTAKTYNRKKLDINQEVLCLGFANLLASFLNSLPLNGECNELKNHRKTIVKSNFTSIISAGIIGITVAWLMPYIGLIPKVIVAAILIANVILLIDLNTPVQLWKNNRPDFYNWLLCLLVCLIFGIDAGLLFGIVFNLTTILFMWAKPEVHITIDEIDGMQFIRCTPKSGIYFPGIDHLLYKINKASDTSDHTLPVIIFCHRLIGLDYSAAQGIEKLATELNNRQQALVIYNMDLELEHKIPMHDNITYCIKEETLKEILTQENIRNGTIPLLAHIRASVDLGYKLEPLIRNNSV